MHWGRRGRVSCLQKLWPGLGRGCLYVCTHTNTCSMWFGKAWVFMVLLEGGGGDGDFSREGFIRKGIRGSNCSRNFFEIFVVPPGALACPHLGAFSSIYMFFFSREPWLKGQLSDFKVKTPACPPGGVFVLCPSGLLNRPRCWGEQDFPSLG